MADWPAAISPENRIEYLIDARREVKDNTEWITTQNGAGNVTQLDAKFRDWHFYITPQQTGGFEAMIIETDYRGEKEYSITPFAMGSYRTIEEARQVIVDEIVVKIAVQQAWQDVAG